jgi:hypothetical protein
VGAGEEGSQARQGKISPSQATRTEAGSLTGDSKGRGMVKLEKWGA